MREALIVSTARTPIGLTIVHRAISTFLIKRARMTVKESSLVWDLKVRSNLAKETN